VSEEQAKSVECRPRVLVALATYNEIETLPRLVSEIIAVLPQADVLVVDDNSPDGTGRWCDEFAAREPRLHCIHRPAKLGLGTATLAAIRRAIADAYDVLVTMDADGSHEPRHLPELLAAAPRADVVIGSRYCPGGQIEGWPLARRMASRSINAVSRRLLCLPVRDSSGAFRAYRVPALARLNLEKIEAPGYAYLEELVWHLSRAGASFAEVPITFRQRRAGISKITLAEAAGKVRTIGTLTWRGILGR
jgi:dolichol-phosphate mannosyltransferase